MIISGNVHIHLVLVNIYDICMDVQSKLRGPSSDNVLVFEQRNSNSVAYPGFHFGGVYRSLEDLGGMEFFELYRLFAACPSLQLQPTAGGLQPPQPPPPS